MKKFFTFLLCLLPIFLIAQQNIRGTVIDKDTRQALIGANVSIKNSTPVIGTATDINGQFLLENVPYGRQTLICEYLGYEFYKSDDIVVSSAKEVIIAIELLESSVQMNEVVVKAIRNVTEPLNELAVVSTRSFSVEETERIAASVNDPSRMALAFPGVQQGRDDSENDIIIRGNSSFGMLWRLEGIDIPNPNHFARPGTSGGGVTIFSAQLLSRSDFSTGAMPAEYGNAIAGAFDVHFRKGNMQNREYRTKIGLLGLDFATEGPFKKGQSSYLINYRYSTLGLLNKAGFHLVGERVDNDFQDLSFNLAFNSKDQRNFFTVFGMGGLSEEHYRPVAEALEREADISDHWEDRIQGSNMGAIGATYTHLIDDKSYLKAVVSGLSSHIFRQYDTLSVQDVRFRYNTQKYLDNRASATINYNRKFSNQVRFKTGLIAHQVFYDFFKETAPRSNTSDINNEDNLQELSIKGKGNTQSLQVYAQASYKPNDKLTLNGGLHYLRLFLNKTQSLEPRLSLKYQIHPQHAITAAYGLHGQILPLGTYFYTQTDTVGTSIVISRPNFNLKLAKSHHAVLGYNFYTKNNLRIGLELYTQRLFNIPVQTEGDAAYWMLNNQSDVPNFSVISDGKGLNYGVDLSIEKSFSNKFYFLVTASRFESKYELADGRTFNTKFATRFASTYTFGREFVFKNASTLQAGFRVMYNGGFRYTPNDQVASIEEGTFVADDNRAWEEQVEPFFRIDARLAYRFDKEKYAANISLDVQNVMNRQNTNGVAYDASEQMIYFRTHPSGLIPILSFQFDF